MARSAAIDVGTNTVLLSIVQHDARDSTQLEVLAERATITRLGENVAQTGQIRSERALVTLECLRGYRALIDAWQVDRVRALGTSALRDAEGSDEFLREAALLLGVPLEVISGEREAELTYKGAHSGLSIPDSGERFVFDIGGGSTELIWGRGPDAFERAVSLQLGSVRLFEELRPSDPYTDADRARLETRIAEVFEKAELEPGLWARSGLAIGVAGTVTSLAAIALSGGRAELGSLHGTTLELDRARQTFHELSMMSLAERITIPCLGFGRADVIVCGAAIALHIMKLIEEARPEHSDTARVHVSDRGVRFGALQEMGRALRGSISGK